MEYSSQDYDSALVKPFKAIKINAFQRRASVYSRSRCIMKHADVLFRLEGLLKTLTHQQIRELQSAIEAIDMHCDILTKLPLEISQLILRYLPLHQIFQARRVSSKWKQLLSTAQMVNSLMRDWYPQPGIESDLHIPAGLSAERVASLKAEHIDAYRTGNAFKYAKLSCEDLSQSIDSNRLAYADGMMAWVDETDPECVRILDLKTGQEWSFLPENRPYIHAIAISSSMAVLLGSSRCYVLSLKTGYNYFLRLPSDRTASIAVSGESLAIVYCDGYNEKCQHTSALTWTLKNQKTSSFALPFSLQRRAYSIMLDKRGETLLLFRWASVDDSQGSMRFHYVRSSLDGSILAQGVISADLKDYWDRSGNFGPMEVNEQAVIWSFGKPQPEGGDSDELMLIYYNFKEDQLEVRKQIVRGLRIKHQVVQCTQSPFFHWKDIGYFLDYSHKRRSLRLVDFQDSTCSEAKMGTPRGTQGFDKALFLEKDLSVALFGDETFLVAVFGGGFCVWCFDANTQMFDEDIAFQEQRKIDFETRLRWKQYKTAIGLLTGS